MKGVKKIEEITHSFPDGVVTEETSNLSKCHWSLSHTSGGREIYTKNAHTLSLFVAVCVAT